MATIPCFLCGKTVESRIDKNQKPYFVCDPCGLQAFIRRKAGIERLAQLSSAISERQLQINSHTLTLFEIRGILTEIEGVKQEIEKLDAEIGIFFPDPDKLSAQKTLKRRLANLLNQLRAISEKQSEEK
jgi:chaperonin cofactor prefoldin